MAKNAINQFASFPSPLSRISITTTAVFLASLDNLSVQL
jgi:hypothetical protein